MGGRQTLSAQAPYVLPSGLRLGPMTGAAGVGASSACQGDCEQAATARACRAAPRSAPETVGASGGPDAI